MKVHAGAALMVAYVLFLGVGAVIVWRTGLLLDAYAPDASLAASMARLVGVIMISWPLAVRVTPDDRPDQPKQIILKGCHPSRDHPLAEHG
jgi:hypothetical protein